MQISSKQLKTLIKQIIQENERRPSKAAAGELLDAGLRALDSAIDSFHKAMDADPIFFERKLDQKEEETPLYHLIRLEEIYDFMNALSSNPVSQWDDPSNRQ